MVQQCAGLAGRRPNGKASVISVGSYNESSYLEKICHLGGLPTNFEDIHKRKKPSFDQLPDGCFSLSGQYTISHKTRKSRGLVFTTTNKESKSSGLNRLDEMSGCFSLSGQYTISHMTRKSRGSLYNHK